MCGSSVLSKTPDSTYSKCVVLIVDVLVAIVEILEACLEILLGVVAIVLRRTPVVVISKTTHNVV